MTKVDQEKIFKKIQISTDLLAFAYAVKRHQLALRFTGMSDEELKTRTWALLRAVDSK